MEQVDINNLIFGGRRVKKTDLSDIMYDFFLNIFLRSWHMSNSFCFYCFQVMLYLLMDCFSCSHLCHNIISFSSVLSSLCQHTEHIHLLVSSAFCAYFLTHYKRVSVGLIHSGLFSCRSLVKADAQIMLQQSSAVWTKHVPAPLTTLRILGIRIIWRNFSQCDTNPHLVEPFLHLLCKEMHQCCSLDSIVLKVAPRSSFDLCVQCS